MEYFRALGAELSPLRGFWRHKSCNLVQFRPRVDGSYIRLRNCCVASASLALSIRWRSLCRSS